MSDSMVTEHVAHVLPAFVVGTLAPEERREVLAHLTDCSICRAELAAWHTIQEALREPSPDLLADDTLLHALWRRVDAAPGAAPSRLHSYREGNGNGRHRGRRPQEGTAPAWSLPPAPMTTTTAPLPTALPRGRWSAAHIAPLLLVVILGLGVFTLGPGRSLLMNLIPHANVRTMEAPGFLGADSDEVLVQATLPAAMVPVGERVRSCLSHIVIPPHARSTWDAEDAVCCPGTRLNFVLKGTYAVWPDGPVQIIRADRTTESAPAGSELLLTEGDTIVMRSDTPYAADNPEDTPAELLQYILAYPPAFPLGTATLAGWTELDYAMPDIPLQGGPATVSLHRIVLGPEAVLAGPPGMALMQVTMPPDHGADAPPPRTIVSARIFPGLKTEIRYSGREEPTTVYVLALEPAGIALMP